MVGLPARGKTFMSQRIRRYLSWLGIPTKAFNVGNYRRQICGAECTHDFFDFANEEAARQRLNAAVAALQDMLQWLQLEPAKSAVAIYDATNSTRSRRQMVFEACAKAQVQVLFIESLCSDEALILHNIRDVKVSSPDYAHMTPEEAAEDFKRRIAHYESAYETVDEGDYTFVKSVNVGSKLIINRITCYLQSQIIYFLANLHIKPRSVYICRVAAPNPSTASRSSI
jgi:hypothetical protein